MSLAMLVMRVTQAGILSPSVVRDGLYQGVGIRNGYFAVFGLGRRMKDWG